MTHIANWKMAIEIADFSIENGGSFHIAMLTYQRVSENTWESMGKDADLLRL